MSGSAYTFVSALAKDGSMDANFHGLSDSEVGIIAEVLAPFAAKIERVCLFGSRATGRFKYHSDVDIVLFGMVDREDLSSIYSGFLESYLGLSVDVKAYHLVTNAAMKRHIDLEARLLLTREELGRV